ncbi:hypothetical protein M9Y10_045627 [Tritrichomonas musculus]|uniref:F5/8 type C domain-containing protein n=1 Tax=Tritrichomonas musculus TaxID=1915356 RepID=A0ABR2JYQ0_9EUKA
MSESRDQYDQIITEFLFKCLDHFGRPASVLFSLATCNNFRQIDLTRLHKDYSATFDFHFISEELVSRFYTEESANLGKTFQLKEEIDRLKTEQEKMRGEIERLKKREEEYQQHMQEEEGRAKEINEQKEEIRKLKEEQEKMSGEIQQLRQMQENLKKEKETESERKEKDIQQLKLDEEERISQIRTDFSNQLKSLKSQIKDLTEKRAAVMAKQEEKRAMPPSIRTRFSGSSNRNGLISELGGGVTLSATGYINPSYPVTNIKSYDNNYFFNYSSNNPTTESESIIKFDFGSSRRVDLYSYFIRSNCCGPSYYHPKSWRIEGSNDDRLWTLLDSRLNDEHLRGGYKEHHFECQENRHLDEHSRFRYIRYVQRDSWLDQYPYNVYLTYFELYGDVFNI